MATITANHVGIQCESYSRRVITLELTMDQQQAEDAIRAIINDLPSGAYMSFLAGLMEELSV